MNIHKIANSDFETLEAVNQFLNQLVEKEYKITQLQLEAIISDYNSNLFFASNEDGQYLGMLTVGIYHAPTGKKAWIEDVVVDQRFRGEGVGIALTDFAIQFAKDQQAEVVILTSKPSRISANNLYKKLGFQLKETNVYRFPLK